MAWVKLDDRFFTNPKIMRAGRDARELYLVGLTYCAAELTDGLIPEEALPLLSAYTQNVGADMDALVERLVAVGLWVEVDDGYAVHDYLEYNPSAEEVRREREAGAIRKQLYADPFTVQRVKDRDKNRCRYCGVKVNWHDRRGPSGGTLDHVLPINKRTSSDLDRFRLNSDDNLVVACRYHNSSKGSRTPEEAGMVLLPPGTEAPPEKPRQAGGPGTSSDLGRNQKRTSPDLSHIPYPSPNDSLSPPKGGDAPVPANPNVVEEPAPTAVRAAPKPNKSAEVIDLVRAADVPIDMTAQDHAALKRSSLSAHQVAEVYVSLARREFGTDWQQDNLSVQVAIKAWAAYQTRHTARANGTAPPRAGRRDATSHLLDKARAEEEREFWYGQSADAPRFTDEPHTAGPNEFTSRAAHSYALSAGPGRARGELSQPGRIV